MNGRAGQQSDLVSECRLLSRQIENVAEQPTDRGPQAMEDTEWLAHGAPYPLVSEQAFEHEHGVARLHHVVGRRLDLLDGAVDAAG